MTQEAFRVVAELYRFLATTDPDSIRAASSLPNVSDNLRVALEALHRECSSQVVKKADAAKPKRTNEENTDIKTTMLYNVLVYKKIVASKADLEKMVSELKIDVAISSKDSHERLARRVSFKIARTDALREAVYKYLKVSPDSQTRGYFDLIRRGC